MTLKSIRNKGLNKSSRPYEEYEEQEHRGFVSWTFDLEYIYKTWRSRSLQGDEMFMQDRPMTTWQCIGPSPYAVFILLYLFLFRVVI